MKTVQPIRDIAMIADMKDVLMKQHYRNYFYFVLGINTGSRINDLLVLRVGDVRDKSHITITEQKSGKLKRFRSITNSNNISVSLRLIRTKQHIFSSQREVTGSHTQGSDMEDTQSCSSRGWIE